MRLLQCISAGAAAAVLAASCGSEGVHTSQESAVTMTQATFLHAGFAAGPAVFTDVAGNLLEERRYEPFGAPIDARVRSGTTYVVGDPDVVARDLNTLNKRTEAVSGWSDHGARWLAPETGRWLTTDPPVEGPDVKFMFAPWRLHPYQYVDQNPIAYWDPDGRETEKLKGLRIHSRFRGETWSEKLGRNVYNYIAAVLVVPALFVDLKGEPRPPIREVTRLLDANSLPTLSLTHSLEEPTTLRSTSRPPHIYAHGDTFMRALAREEARYRQERDRFFKAPLGEIEWQRMRDADERWDSRQKYEVPDERMREEIREYWRRPDYERGTEPSSGQ